MTNSKFQELLDKLKKLKLKQLGVWEDDIPDYIYYEYFTDFEVVALDINPAKYRWYEVSTTVVRVQGGLLGIDGVTRVYSENMSFSDIEFQYHFFEVREKVTTTFVPV